MKGFSFPITKTKISDLTIPFRLEDPVERRRYFDGKVGREIAFLRAYLRTGTFVGFLLGKKNSGKGTYSKLFSEAVGLSDRIAHISVGDIVRSAHEALESKEQKQELLDHLRRRYRGFIPTEQIFDIILGRDTKTLLPTEVILVLLEREIAKLGRKAIFIDGFPRDLDQISYSLYFREIMGYRDDPDFFAFIDVPERVIDERIKNRVICPKCHTPRSLKLLRTKDIGYDAGTGEFYLMCDNPSCGGLRMVTKEGDSLGIEPLRNRIELDDKVMRALLQLQGVPKVYLRNSVPVLEAKENVDDYEITPAYRYIWDPEKRIVQVIEEPWVVKDDDGNDSFSLLPAAVVVSLIKQTAVVLGFS